jgi:UDP-N-acetylmuramate dehydrogenase
LEFKRDVLLSPFTNFQIGGLADCYVEVNKPRETLEAVLKAKAENLKYVIIAGGKNVLVSDDGFRGLVIHITGGELQVQGNKMIADAGVLLSGVTEKAVEFGLAGIETLSGIPGSLGGAIVGNAGAYGHSVSEVVDSVEIFDGEEVRTISKDDCLFGYRDSIFKKNDWVVLRATLVFGSSTKDDLEKVARPILDSRSKKFAWDAKCAGSFFKNIIASEVSPESLAKIDQKKIVGGKIPAGYLLESVGASGMRVGDIYVADFHSNVLLNGGKGKAGEVKELALQLKTLVRNKFGIELTEEVRYIA